MVFRFFFNCCCHDHYATLTFLFYCSFIVPVGKCTLAQSTPGLKWDAEDKGKHSQRRLFIPGGRPCPEQ